jgi:hypothetical protein
MSQYNLCVEEIKNEGNVLGSLELHEEAMRRLNQRLRKDCMPRYITYEERLRDGVARRPRKIRTSPSRKGNVLAQSIIDIGLRVTGKHGHVDSDPSKVKLSGRRQTVEYNESFTAAQVLQDLDLPDSEDEGVESPTYSPGQVDGGGSSGGRCGSFLRGCSTSIGIPLGPTAVMRFSKRGSLDLFDSDDEGVSPPMHSPTHSRGETVEGGGNSGERRGWHLSRSSSSVGRPLRVAVVRFSKRRSSASIEGDSHVLASKTHVDADGCEGNDDEGKSSIMKDGKPTTASCVLISSSGLKTKNDAGQHAADLKEGGSSESNGRKPTMNDGKKGEHSNAELIVSWQQSRRRMPIACNEQPSPVMCTRTRMGRRRSSLSSVNERRSSVNLSSVSSSFNGSMTEASLTGSSTGKMWDVSLICSFQSRNSLTGSHVQDGDLICDWERRQSLVSESSYAQSIQEGLLNGKEVKGAPGSLICGWDQSDQKKRGERRGKRRSA